MRMSQWVGKRIKETPHDAQTASHRFLLRGGYMRPVAAGIYSLLPLGARVIRKIESIIREEMNRVGGQEVILPVVMPRDMWEESGRYQSIDNTMVRFKDRNGADMLLGMTHEEAVVSLARTEINSYRQLPAMLYQIQTKFRDEARPRGGLVRVREFTMKDAYSFHSTQADLERYYQRVYESYERIFRRVGLKNTLSVQSDTGMMGGKVAHEFMLVTPIGEDSLVVCRACGYSANNEVAVCRHEKIDQPGAETPSIVEVPTPERETIEDVARFLNVSARQTAKVVFLRAAAPKEAANAPARTVMAVVRGDREVNLVKLAKILKREIIGFATDDEIRATGAEPGYASPIRLRDGASSLDIVIDESVFGESTVVTGANREGHHLTGVVPARDFADRFTRADISFVRSGDHCLSCGKELSLVRGIEIGNIFQLGTRYSAAMGMSVLGSDGVASAPIMGCYGIGVGRLMASVIEDRHDDFGPCWPASIAPFSVHLCAIGIRDDAVKSVAEALYRDLESAGIEVLFDDTDGKPGSQFADADLIGAPLRLVVSPKNLKDSKVEYRHRDGSAQGQWSLDEVVSRVVATLKGAL